MTSNSGMEADIVSTGSTGSTVVESEVAGGTASVSTNGDAFVLTGNSLLNGGSATKFGATDTPQRVAVAFPGAGGPELSVGPGDPRPVRGRMIRSHVAIGQDGGVTAEDDQLPDLGGDLEPHDGSAADYVLRTAQQEVITVSVLADQKANILLGVSLIMVTGLVGVLPSVGFTIALAVLGTTTVTAALLPLLCLAPNVGQSRQPTNPLYFADVARMTFPGFRRRMVDVLATSPSIYEAILVDLHASSRNLLQRKFRYLRLAYSVFLVGLLLTVIAVVIDVAVGNV